MTDAISLPYMRFFSGKGNHMDPLSLYASLVWGTVGFAFFIYGKKRKRQVPLIGGIVIMAVSYFLKPMALSLTSVAVMAAIYFFSKRM